MIERGIGAERIIERAFHNPTRTGLKDALNQILNPARITGKQIMKETLRQAGKQITKTGVGEFSEEALQEYLSAGTEVAAGYGAIEDLLSDEQLQKALVAGAYGGAIGAAAGFGMHSVNRVIVKRRVNEWAKKHGISLSDNQLNQMANELIDETQDQAMGEIMARAEIQNKYGEAYNIVKQRVLDQINATGTVPWQDKAKTKEEYAEAVASTVTPPAIYTANKLNIPLTDFLKIADVDSWVIGNILGFKPITSVADIDEIIAKQNAIIKDQREKKKLGIDDPDVLDRAKQRKAIAERVRREVVADQEIAKRRSTARKATSDYITAKELQPTSVASLENVTTAQEGEDYTLFAGKKIPVQYEVVELASIQPSHINGTTNPNYTNEQLQNRASRGTVQDVADLREKASIESFTPERLMKSATSAEGAPVINAQGDVIAGNGRAEIVRYAYENPETAEKYKAALIEQGFNIEGMEQPILVRRNTTLTPDEQIAAADISNISETSAFDEASQARRDSKYLADSKDPTEFASKLPMSERRGLMQNNGKWNKRRVQQRYESALLSWLCGNDTQLFENLVLDRGINQKVLDILTTNGNMIYETATKYPDLTIREDIYHALVKMQTTTKDNFLEMTQQLSLDGHDVMPENIMVWNWLFTDATTNRQFLDYYMQTLTKNQEESKAGEDMFGDKISPLSKKDALMQALKKADQAKAEMAASRGKEYEPLFNENGVTNDPILLSAIASYKNQFAPTEQLNQRVFVSMKGAMEGEYLDADRFLGKGDDTRVWLWGNYTLLDERIDKQHYFDRFEDKGPALTYDGEEVTHRLLDKLGIKTDEAKQLIINRATNLGLSKDWFVKTLTTYHRNTQDLYNSRVNKVVKWLIAEDGSLAGKSEEYVRNIIKDIETITIGKGSTVGALFGFPKNTTEGKIQDKYLKDEEKKNDLKTVYDALVGEFGGEDNLTSYKSIFARYLADLHAEEKTLEAVKKLDFNKLGGRTGLNYKGLAVKDILEKMNLPQAWLVNDKIVKTIQNAIIKKKDIVKELNNLTEKMGYDEESFKKDAFNQIEKEAKGNKSTIDLLKNTVDQLLNDTDTGASMYSIYQKMGLNDDQKEIMNRVFDNMTPRKYGLSSSISDMLFSIRGVKAIQRSYDQVKQYFKDAKPEDFVYKPSASMYAAEAPENDVLLNASRDLDKQPKKVQEAIFKTIREYGSKYPGLHLLDVIYSGIPRSYRDEQARMFEKMFNLDLEVGAAFVSDRITEQLGEDYANNADEFLWDVLYEGLDYALIMKDNPTLADVVEGIHKWKERIDNDHYRNSIQHTKENIAIDYILEFANQQDLTQPVSNFTKELSDFKGIELTGENAFTFLKRLVDLLTLNPNIEEDLKKDTSLGLTANPPADEIIIKMFRKNGIEGLKYYGRRDKHGIVTWDKTPVTEQLYSLDLTNKLVATHGITIDKLNKALALGGLPVPSIGISKATDPLKDFGDIKLVGTKDIIDPESDPANKVYDRDIWSSTFPMPQYKNATIKQSRAFREKFGKYFSKTDSYANLNDLLYYATNSTLPYQAIGKFLYSEGAQVYYIENVLGEKFDIPMENRNLIRLENSMPFVKPDEQFIEEVSQIDNNVDNSDVLRKALDKPLRDLIARSPATEKEKQHAQNYFFGENKEGLFNFNNHSVFNLVSAVKEYKANKDEMSVDNLGLMHALANYNLINDSKYVAWAEKEMANLLGEPMVKVGNRKLPWTKENIAKAMMRGPIVGSEGGMETSIGKVIASGARQFGSIEDIRQAGQQLNTMDTANQITDTLGGRISQFAQNIINQGYGEYDRTNIMDALVKVVSKPNPTKEALLTALRQKLEDPKATFDDALLEEGVQVAKDVRNVSRYYFEAKPQRVVGFNEFAGAVVPLDPVYDESAAQLQALGLDVVRTNSVEVGIDQIAARNRDVLFQGRKALVRGSYDPELQTIILNKNWNELTLVHELHHSYLQMIWGYFKQAQAGARQVSQDWLEDTEKLFRMLEIDPNQDQMTTVQQEKFTYMVEAYLTGLGVDNTDNLAFQGFLHWVPEQYRSIMDLGYLDENNMIQNPMLDEEAIAWFNKWFASPFAPSLPSAPDAQRMINSTDGNGQIIPSNQKIMNNREKEWGQDSEEQLKADAQLRRAISENTPSDMRAALDGEKELMKVETKNLPDDTKLPEEQKQTFRERWFKAREKNARERAAEMARNYLAEHPDHARELAFADPEISVEYDAPVDRGMLIRAVMETVPHGSEEWYILNDNLAMVKSMAGSALALPGDQSHQAYLDAKREIEAARELKAAVNYAGTSRGAMEKWDGDIKAFIARKAEAILSLAPDSEERKVAIKAMLEEAKTKFSGNTTNAILNQLDLTGMRTKSRQVFIDWAEKQIKQAAHARIDTKEQQELMKASIAAQLALRDIDSTEQKDGKFVRAVQSGKDINHWQYVKDKMKKAYIGRWGKFGIFVDNLLGSYAPSAMLMSVNTLFFANVPSTAVNTGTIRLAAKGIGKNMVDNQVQKDEIHRIKQIFNATGMNLAQMDKPTSPSTLHGEKYMNTEQKHWYNFTFEILGRTDNVFRVPTFVDALARIATKNANGDKARATALFKEYCRLNTTSDEAKIARKQALAVANMAVFTQDGIMASALNHIRSSLNTMSRAPFGLDPNGFGLGNILAPFLKTGVNVTEMGLDASLALPRSIIMGMKKLQGKQIPEIDKIALRSDWINLAWMSVVIAVLAAINSDDDEWYEEPYQPGRTYDPNKPYDSVNFGGVWIKLDIFGPLAIPLRAALKMVNEWEKKKLDAVADGLFFGGMEALSDTPLVNQFTDNSLDYMTKNQGAYWSSFGYNQLNKFMPAQAKTISKALTRGANVEFDTDWMGKTISRKFHRNYGLDGQRLTTNDLINILTNRVKVKVEK